MRIKIDLNVIVSVCVKRPTLLKGWSEQEMN
jgi:hypothetical protein